MRTFFEKLRTVFSDALAGDPSELLDDGSYCGTGFCDSASAGKILPFVPDLSLDRAPVQHRIIIKAVRGKGPEKAREKDMEKAAEASSVRLAEKLAGEYGKYVLTYAAAHPGQDILRLLAVNNRV